MFFFRADSNPVISGGHINRCISIATTLIDADEQVCFLIADDNPVSILQKNNLPFINLHSDWADLSSDVQTVKKLLSENENPVLIIDTYTVTKDYIKELKPYCKIAYLGSKQEPFNELDLLINYSVDIDYSFYHNNYSEKTNLLLGASYAPLRKEFQKEKHISNDTIKQILLTSGNTDQNNIIDNILSAIQPTIEKYSITTNVVIGRMFESRNKLYTRYDNHPFIRLCENVTSMSSLIQQSDLAISANGTTIYELSAMGVPTISFAMVEEQLQSAEAFSKLGAVDYCGPSFRDSNSCSNLINTKLNHYISNPESLIDLANRAHDLIDGSGCQRIVYTLKSLKMGG